MIGKGFLSHRSGWVAQVKDEASEGEQNIRSNADAERVPHLDLK